MLLEKDYGVKPIRLCNQAEKEYVLGLWKVVEEEMNQHKAKEIFWKNFYVEGEHLQFKDQPEQQKELMSFMKKLTEQLFPGEQLQTETVGFLLSPGGHSEYQNFHYDFHSESRSIFIPLVHLTTFNSTQYISFVPKSKPFDDCHIFRNEVEILEKEGLDFFEMKQVICKPFTILKVPPFNVHRGIGNRTEENRPMFYILLFPKGKKLNLPVRAYEQEGLFVNAKLDIQL